jgi:hypothetical protein
MTTPLEDLSAASFEPHTGSEFTVPAGDMIVTLRLDSVRLLGHRRPEATRDPFALTFLGPQGLRLPQGIYQFSREGFGEAGMFITQTGDGARGSEFEAVFT